MQDLTLISHSHQRYQNGVPVMGKQTCDRAIIVQNKKFEDLFNGCKNVEPSEGYIVRLINIDINQDQMMPKLMKLERDNGDSILLKGITLKVMGITPQSADHKDYGLKLLLRNRNVVKCILYMYDRNTEIEYIIG